MDEETKKKAIRYMEEYGYPPPEKEEEDDEEYYRGVLDDIVRDATDMLASSANNGGMEEQLKFLALVDSMAPDEYEVHIRLFMTTDKSAEYGGFMDASSDMSKEMSISRYLGELIANNALPYEVKRMNKK